MTRPGIEPRFPGPLANTLTIIPLSGNIYLQQFPLVWNHLTRFFLHPFTLFWQFLARQNLVWYHFNYLGESKVLQYFGNVSHNSAALDAFVDVVNETKYTGLWDAKFTWYSPSDTPRICFYGLEHELGFYDFKATRSYLIIELFATQAKFLEITGNSTKINCTFLHNKCFSLFASVALRPFSNS